MKDIIKEIRAKAKQRERRILLPEANLDGRVYDACKYAIKKHLAHIVVLGKASQFDSDFVGTDCTIIDIEKFEKLDEFATQLYDLRKAKGMTLEEAKEKIRRPDYFSMMLLKNNYADGVVAGATWSTADTLRPALQVIKADPAKSLVTGCMLMVKKGKSPFVFGDVSLVENPTSEQLAEIAISCAEFFEKTLSATPRVALLSYSTKGSAKGEMVEKISKAADLAKEKSSYHIDGEMQLDAALDLTTAKQKGITGEVAGQANVLIFPDLNAGNIGYKLTARLGGYTAVGPIMLNFNQPVNDLSRGSNVEEIINTICITSLQSK